MRTNGKRIIDHKYEITDSGIGRIDLYMPLCGFPGCDNEARYEHPCGEFDTIALCKRHSDELLARAKEATHED